MVRSLIMKFERNPIALEYLFIYLFIFSLFLLRELIWYIVVIRKSFYNSTLHEWVLNALNNVYVISPIVTLSTTHPKLPHYPRLYSKPCKYSFLFKQINDGIHTTIAHTLQSDTEEPRANLQTTMDYNTSSRWWGFI